MNEENWQKIEAIVGSENVLRGDEAILEPYSHDATTGGATEPHFPEGVVFPKCAEEISRVMRLANAEHFPVTVRGGGTGLSGGAVPVSGGIVLAMNRLNHILEIDRESLTVTLEPGVIVKELNDALQPFNLTFPCFPISYDECFIGGNVATNAGGSKALKYGVTGQYVLGLNVVTPQGEILELGGKLQKNVTGYNLMPLFIGSEGTLGIITRLTLKIVTLPSIRIDLLAFFPDDRTAIRCVPRLITDTGVLPASVEYIDRLSIQVAQKFLNDPLDYHDCGAALLFSLDGFSLPSVEEDYRRLREFVVQNGALGIAEGRTDEERVRLWAVRRNVAKAFKAISQYQTVEDIVLPPGKLPEMLEELRALARKFDVQIATFGHAGDGNLHPRIVGKPEWPREKWLATLEELFPALYQAAFTLGGQISGEHGIGSKRRKFIHLTVPEANLKLMRTLKKTLDPNNVLNPGKIF